MRLSDFGSSTSAPSFTIPTSSPTPIIALAPLLSTSSIATTIPQSPYPTAQPSPSAEPSKPCTKPTCAQPSKPLTQPSIPLADTSCISEHPTTAANSPIASPPESTSTNRSTSSILTQPPINGVALSLTSASPPKPTTCVVSQPTSGNVT
ncbi:MAG: hypothetical protein WDW38_011336 [Sanguina aurantia]